VTRGRPRARLRRSRQALEQGLGDGFTPEVREAWVETYGLFARVMKDAAAGERA
jgi:hemoglobin-like flavoprotein